MNDLELKYFNFLVSENEKYNLTNITDLEEAKVKHFEDSIKLEELFDLNSGLSLCDVGSGAGFPAIPLKIKYPSLKVTIIEPTGKRCNFLNEVIKLLDLKDINVICDRAENVTSLKESFDIVTARAVANLPILLELCTPLAKVDGWFVAYKGSNFEEEINLASNASKELSCKLEKIHPYHLKGASGEDYGMHALIKYHKVSKTNPKYPRNYSQIKKKPL